MPSDQKKIYLLPEAQATSWDELMPPVKTAVKQLLFRIQAAHLSIIGNKNESTLINAQQAGSCFLVYGLRGTGKTSVLLNAQRAVKLNSRIDFFKNTEESFTNDDIDRKVTKDYAERLNKEIIWLEILDLEPLPSEANLLTVLLTKIRDALNNKSDSRHNQRRSVFEEEANSARQQLTKLINDATYMWDNVKEVDTRNLSQRQVKAAEIYTGFKASFIKAMDKLVKELKDSPDSEKKLSIILPIDNIDRSAEHLQSIVKLAQLVVHPNLWLVMAGDRVEVETFLERAYWKELIRSNDGAGAQGKMDSDGEDEALAMARRQANATAQKLWPTNHRVEVNLVKPKETLEFKYRHDSENKDIKNIRGLLECIKIPITDDQRQNHNQKQEGENNHITLLDLFYIEDKVSHQHKLNVYKKSIDPKYLTRAAYHGLLLPARNLLDLWLLLHSLVEEGASGNGEGLENNRDFKAEKVARTMLRIAISSSDMNNEIAQDLQFDILRRGENGGTILNFLTSTLKVVPMSSANYDFEHALVPVISNSQDGKYVIRSQLEIQNIEDIVLKLKYKYLPIEPYDTSSHLINNQYQQPFVIENACEKQWTELCPQVSAWLMILFDILILAEAKSSSWVMGAKNPNNIFPNVSIIHTVVELGKYKKKEVQLYWKPPYWGHFWGRNIFSLCWQDFLKKLAERKNTAPESTPELLAAGWILCVLKTSVELIKACDNGRFKDSDDTLNNLFSYILKIELLILEDVIEELIELEGGMVMEDVMKVVVEFYELIQQEKINAHQVNLTAYEAIIKTGKWMEIELIYLLISANALAKNSNYHKIWTIINNSELGKYWRHNLPFIWADLNKSFPIFKYEDDQRKNELDKQAKSIQTIDEGKTLGELLFSDLFVYLKQLGI